MTTEWERTRCRRRVERLAGSSVDADELRFELVEELRRTIGFAAWGWPLADPDSLLATAGIADRAMWSIVPRLVDYEERTEDVNKDRALATSGDPVGVLSAATRGDLAESPRWREILGPHGFADELRLACVDRFGCWGHLRLYRDSIDKPFSSADAEMLRHVAPTIASALRRAAVKSVEAPSLEPLAPGFVILDEHLSVRSWTAGLGAWFDAFAGDRAPRGMYARCAVFSVASRCVARGASKNALPARARLRLSDGRWVVAEASRLRGADRGVVVGVRAATNREVLDVVARAHALTPRERELVAALVEGLDTRDIARRLCISRHTVQQHLKSVFDKVGVRSRRELVTGRFARLA